MDAGDADEEVYSRIFSALRHGVRRRILRMLSKGKLTFTSMCDGLGITSSHLTYHLDALGELISKDDYGYALSVFGRAAVSMMSSVEDSPVPPPRLGANRWFKALSAILLVGLVVVSGLYVDLSGRFREQEKRVEALMDECEAISESYGKFAGMEDLVDILVEQPYTRFAQGYSIVSGFSLEYWHDWAYEAPIRTWRRQFIVFYAPVDGLRLSLHLYAVCSEEGALIPLTLQRGNAFHNESGVFVEERVYPDGSREEAWQSPVIWTINATGNEAHEAALPSEGWYTLCMTGPISKLSGGGMTLTGLVRGRLVNGTWQKVESVHAWVDFRLLDGEEPVWFIIDKSQTDFY